MTTGTGLWYQLQNSFFSQRRLQQAVVVFILGLMLLSGGAQAAEKNATIDLDATNNATNVSVACGQELLVRLKENPSTGYTWNVLQQDSHLLELISKTFIPPEKSIPGAPGKALFVFKAINPGETKLELGYFRTWEGEQNAAEHFQVTISITGGL